MPTSPKEIGQTWNPFGSHYPKCSITHNAASFVAPSPPVEVVARLACLDGAQVLCAHADPFGERLLGDAVCLELDQQLLQRNAGQIGFQIRQPADRLA